MRVFSSPRQFISNKMQRFFAKRAPRHDDATLNLRNVYIFFSREGLLYALLLAITFVTGVNYGNNLVLGLCFYLVSIWVISLHLTFAHVAGLRLSLSQAPLTQAGQLAWITVDVTNDKAKPSRQLHLNFDEPLSHSQHIDSSQSSMPSEDFQLTDGSQLIDTSQSTVTGQPQLPITQHKIIASLQGTQSVSLPVPTTQRGRMRLPRLKVSTVYPLGIMRAWSYVYFDTAIWVYPKPLAFDWREAHVATSDEDNEWSVHVNQGQNDFDTLDEYIPGESLARVSWGHVARGQGMLTKQFADAKGKKIRLDYADMPAVHHEDKLSQLTYAVLLAAQSGDAFALVLPDGLDGLRSGDIALSTQHRQEEMGQGEAFLQACLLRLAMAK